MAFSVFHVRLPTCIFILIFGISLGFFGALRHLKPGNSSFEPHVNVSQLLPTVKLMCLVLTTRQYHRERAVFVKDTWGKQCDKLVFVSDFNEPFIGAVQFSSSPLYGDLWPKVREAFRWVYNGGHVNNFDWFLKADDDTFIDVGNLKLFLAINYSPNEPVYTGRHFIECNTTTKNYERPPPSEQRYYASGGAGYVISRQAVKQLVEKALMAPQARTESPICNRKGDVPTVPYEDVNMGRCLAAAGVKLVESRDASNRHRFIFLTPGEQYVPDQEQLYWMAACDRYPTRSGEWCCSPVAVSFHYVKGKDMVSFDVLINKFRTIGLQQSSSLENILQVASLPRRNDTQARFNVSQFLVQNGYSP